MQKCNACYRKKYCRRRRQLSQDVCCKVGYLIADKENCNESEALKEKLAFREDGSQYCAAVDKL